MSTERLNIDFPADDYSYLKIICAEKGVTIKDFVVPLILKAIDEEEDAKLTKKVKRRLKDVANSKLITTDEAFKLAGWKD